MGVVSFEPVVYWTNYFPCSTVILTLNFKITKLILQKHRVLIPEEEALLKKGRQSLAFFIHPDDEVMIECLDGSGKYEGVSSIDYLNMRFAETYN